MLATASPSNFTSICLRIFIVSILATAAIGASAMLMPTGGGWFPALQIKILLTTSLIAATSVCGLTCGGCLKLGRRVLPTIGIALVGVSAIFRAHCHMDPACMA